MKNVYTATIHAQCPVDDSWDYYSVVITSKHEIRCETITEALNQVRGRKLTQENVAQSIDQRLDALLEQADWAPDLYNYELELVGVHPQGVTVCSSLNRTHSPG